VAPEERVSAGSLLASRTRNFLNPVENGWERGVAAISGCYAGRLRMLLLFGLPAAQWACSGGGLLPFGYGATPFETTLVMAYGGTRAELIEVQALGAPRAHHAPHQRFGLDQVEQVYRRMPEGGIQGRAVVTPNT